MKTRRHICGLLFNLISSLIFLKNINCVNLEQDRCDFNTTTQKDYWLQVRNDPPQSINGKVGLVPITATVVGAYESSDVCEWSIMVDKLMETTSCTNITEPRKFLWSFSNSGTKLVKVQIHFDYGTMLQRNVILNNCTFINVTDCSRQLRLTVATSGQSFNVSRNRTKLVLDSPKLVIFTITVFNIVDPFHVCRPLTYTWDFGDGQRRQHGSCNISHFYNSSGVYNMSVFSKQLEKINLTISIEDRSHTKQSDSETTLDISLVFVIVVIAAMLLTVFLTILKKKTRRQIEVASFDFRASDMQSNDGQLCHARFLKRFKNHRPREENHYLLPYKSTYRKFGSTLQTEEL